MRQALPALPVQRVRTAQRGLLAPRVPRARLVLPGRMGPLAQRVQQGPRGRKAQLGPQAQMAIPGRTALLALTGHLALLAQRVQRVR